VRSSEEIEQFTWNPHAIVILGLGLKEYEKNRHKRKLVGI